MQFFPLPRLSRGRSGAALVIVLAFVVLLTGLTVAFFSRAVNEHQVSTSSSNQTKTELFTEGAIDTIIADLQQEIADGSVATGTGSYTLYRPAVPATAAPALVGSTGLGGLENLLKISAHNQPFYPSGNYTKNGPDRAAGPSAQSSTTGTSLNGRSISRARWNKPLLLPTTSVDDLTSPSFTAPDWILVDRAGQNPTAWNNNMRTSSTGTTAVIGRYAYAIYNEGGLLDMNAAGYPTGLTLAQTGYKEATAFADLTQLTDAAGNSLLTQSQIDSLVGWRNYASAHAPGAFPNPGFTAASGTQPSASGSNYYNYARFNTQGFMRVGNVALHNSQSDRMFTSRQQLIKLLLDGVGTSASTQAALRYLGTFSRSLNQPSYCPNPDRPKVVGPAVSTRGDYQSSGNGGGNSAYGLDDQFNPSFRSIRVTASFTRNDGSLAAIGEPLVKNRFALSRLCWITYNGPSALLSSGDPVIAAYLDQGVPQSLLSQGTAANILKYFGLVWNSSGKYWTYSQNINQGLGPTIGTLDAVASNAREPNFFELLKASICAGSLAKAAVCIGGFDQGIKSDTSVNYHLLQIGANIIDAADPDSFPTQIVFNDGLSHSFFGKENLPYFYKNIITNAITRLPAPPAPADGRREVVSGSVTLTDEGRIASFIVPCVWNPYSNAYIPSSAALTPSQLRISISMAPNSGNTTNSEICVIMMSPGDKNSTDPIFKDDVSAGSVQPTELNTIGVYDSATGLLKNLVPGNAANTAIYFAYNPASCLDPTPLYKTGGEVSIDAYNTIRLKGGYTTAGIPELGTGGVNNRYIGFFIGNSPVRWKASTEGTVIYTAQCIDHGWGDLPYTMCLEYKNPSGAWLPYQQYPVGNIRHDFTKVRAWYSAASPTDNAMTRWKPNTFLEGMTGLQWPIWDPRTPRWGMLLDVDNQDFIDAARTIVPSARPEAGEPTDLVTHGGPTATPSQRWFGVDENTRLGCCTQNINGSDYYYQDPDGVVRRGMYGAQSSYLPVTAPTIIPTIIGQPMATVTGTLSNLQNRPILLNRPYRSVAELGSVFRDVPFKNLDFSFPESGDVALLDVFSVTDTVTPGGLVAGKVDLNTRNVPVLQAILASAYRDETYSGVPVSANTGAPLSIGLGNEARKLAQALVDRTSGTGLRNGAGAQPLSNIADIVGRYVGQTIPGNNNTPYDGFCADLSSQYSGGADSPNILLQRYRESAIRALANTGMAGTWNLLIDVVAQTGRYPATANNPSEFLVEGEQRYWVHVAIDRQTGAIIDQQFEPVSE